MLTGEAQAKSLREDNFHIVEVRPLSEKSYSVHGGVNHDQKRGPTGHAVTSARYMAVPGVRLNQAIELVIVELQTDLQKTNCHDKA